MFNNDVTYDKQWDTPENRAALAKLERKFFHKSECRADCPVAWAPEVLELMETLEKELGFAYNTKTIGGYYIKGTPYDWFVKEPFGGIVSAFKSNILNKPRDWTKPRGENGFRPYKTIGGRFLGFLGGFFGPMGYGLRALKMKYVHPLLNKILRPKIVLGQLKEKYGYLTCYFHTTDAYREFVDIEIRKCSLKLALKGCYYPIENFWDASTQYAVGTEYNPDTISATYNDKHNMIDVKQTVYRKIMKDMGLDLKEIEQKAILRKASKEDPSV